MSNFNNSDGMFGVVLFQLVHGALAGERRLIAGGIDHKLTTVPRHLSSNCGFCLRFARADKEKVAEMLDGEALGVERINPL